VIPSIKDLAKLCTTAIGTTHFRAGSGLKYDGQASPPKPPSISFPSQSRLPQNPHAAKANEVFASSRVDRSLLALPEPRRFRDKTHVKFVAKQPCLICGRKPSDVHHLRFAQHPALGRKVSDEFVVPLCRGHHREVHRSGDEASWWSKAAIDPVVAARMLWTETHPLRPVPETQNPDVRAVISDSAPIRPRPNAARNRSRVED
jgi:hypothetical protein